MVVESNILGFHVYKEVWTPVTREVLTCEMEDEYFLSFRFCDLLDAATFNALLIEFCAASISFTDRFDKVPLA